MAPTAQLFVKLWAIRHINLRYIARFDA